MEAMCGILRVMLSNCSIHITARIAAKMIQGKIIVQSEKIIMQNQCRVNASNEDMYQNRYQKSNLMYHVSSNFKYKVQVYAFSITYTCYWVTECSKNGEMSHKNKVYHL